MSSRKLQIQEDNQEQNETYKQKKQTCHYDPNDFEPQIQEKPVQQKKICVLPQDWKSEKDVADHLAFYLQEFLRNPLQSYDWKEKKPFKTYRRMSKYLNKTKHKCKEYDDYLRTKYQQDYDNLFEYVVQQAQKYRQMHPRIQRFLGKVQRRVQCIQRHMETVQRNIRTNKQLISLFDNILAQDEKENKVSNEMH